MPDLSLIRNINNRLDRLIENTKEEVKKHDKKFIIHPKEYYYSKEYRLMQQNTCPGDVILAQIRTRFEFIDEHVMRRSKNQCIFHEAMIISNLRNVFGRDYEDNLSRIMEENNWEKVKPYILIITARRMGKTISVAMKLAVNQLSIPKIKQAVFASGTRMSTTMLDHVNSISSHFHDYAAFLSKGSKSAEKIVLINPENEKDKRIMGSYPNKAGEFQPSPYISYFFKKNHQPPNAPKRKRKKNHLFF